MLQYPVNVYPNSQALDSTILNTFNFVFRGDILSKYQLVIYLNSTGAVVFTGSETACTKYNGEMVGIPVSGGVFTNGNDYLWTVKLWDANGATVTSPSYFFKARAYPTLTLSSVPNPYTNRKLGIIGTYAQAQKTAIKYHIWDLKDKNGLVVDTSGKKYSSYLTYQFDGLLDGETYTISLTVTNQDDVSITTKVTFGVDYAAPDITSPPKIEFLDDVNAVKVSWSKNKQSIGIASGAYEIVNNFPFTGTNSVKINTGTVEYSQVSGQELSIDNANFSTIVSVNITNDKQGKIIGLSDALGNFHYLSIDGFNINSYTGMFPYTLQDLSTYSLSDLKNYTLGFLRDGTRISFVKSLLSIILSGQTTTGIAESNVGYVWNDDDVWDDNKYWTETKPFSKQYLIIMKPNEVIVEEVVI